LHHPHAAHQEVAQSEMQVEEHKSGASGTTRWYARASIIAEMGSLIQL
jgi:hypothetical protein